MAASLPKQDDVQFLSDSYDNMVQKKDEIAQELLNLNRRLVELKEDVGRIDKAIDELLFYTTLKSSEFLKLMIKSRLKKPPSYVSNYFLVLELMYPSLI